MRRRAVLVVEYDRESGRPVLAERWEEMVKHHLDVRKVRVEVQSDEPE